MKKIFLFIALVFSIAKLDAQSITQDVIATTGDSYSNSSAMLSFSVGEPMTETFTSPGNMITQGFIQTPITYWVGTMTNAWENSLNWNPAVLPDGNADIIILSSMPRYPVVNSNSFCRSIILQPSSIVTVKPGFNLVITH